MATRPPDFKSSGIRAERLIASGSSTNPRLLLIGSGAAGNDGVTVDTGNLILAGTGSDTWLFISGSTGGSDRVTFGGDVHISGTLTGVTLTVDEFFDSTTNGSIFTTGSAAFRGGESSVDSPSDKGADVFFYVSGSRDGTKSTLFGGNTVYSGSITLKDSGGNATITATQSNGNLAIEGDLTVNGGDFLTNASTVTVFPTNASTISLGSAASSISIGNSAGSTSHTFTVASARTGNVTLNLACGATAVGSTKNLNFGLGADPGVTTNIRIGTTDTGGITNIFMSGSMQITGSIGLKGSITPNSDFTYNLGTPALRWQNVYTGDLHLRNDRGDWTILEEEEFLCVINNKTGKRYKMMLQPLD